MTLFHLTLSELRRFAVKNSDVTTVRYLSIQI